MKNFIPDFTKEEFDYIIEAANFTKQQEQLFRLRNEEYTLEWCAEKMNLSLSTINRIKKKMEIKIAKVAWKNKSTV